MNSIIKVALSYDRATWISKQIRGYEWCSVYCGSVVGGDVTPISTLSGKFHTFMLPKIVSNSISSSSVYILTFLISLDSDKGFCFEIKLYLTLLYVNSKK